MWTELCLLICIFLLFDCEFILVVAYFVVSFVILVGLMGLFGAVFLVYLFLLLRMITQDLDYGIFRFAELGLILFWCNFGFER